MKELGDSESFIGKQLGAETCSKVLAVIVRPAVASISSGNSLRKRMGANEADIFCFFGLSVIFILVMALVPLSNLMTLLVPACYALLVFGLIQRPH